MFDSLGKLATRRAGIVVTVWVVLLVGSFFFVPEWSTIAEKGEFAFLPEDSASVKAEQEFRTAIRILEKDEEQNSVELGMTYNDLGKLLRPENPQEARECYIKARDLANEYNARQ